MMPLCMFNLIESFYYIEIADIISVWRPETIFVYIFMKFDDLVQGQSPAS